MNETGAKPAAVQAVKPNDCEPPDLCPCDPFLKCNSRLPYGKSVWSNPETRKKAMGLIAYSKYGAVTTKDALEKMAEKFEKRNKRNKNKKFNEFFANLYPLAGDSSTERVLTLPEITEGEITAGMNALKGADLYNTAGFTNFQRSIFVRANLVANDLTMRSDLYMDGEKVIFESTEMIPYSGSFSKEQWSVDHIQTRSKGGCNRFCNGAFLTIGANMIKKDEWPGCACIDCEKKADEQIPYTPPSGTKKYKLFECQHLCRANQEKKGRKLPPHPPSIIKEYEEICALDNPCDFAGSLNRNVGKEIDKIRK